MTRIADLDNYTKGAVLSDCGRYRYLLERHWSGGGLAVGFLMLNPSTADADTDDATIRRCVGFAHAWGYRSLYVVNLMAWRATKPDDLPQDIAIAAGARRDNFLQDVGLRCVDVVCAWGASLPRFADDAFIARALWAASNGWRRSFSCLGTTANGQPRHPLYVKGDTELMEYRP